MPGVERFPWRRWSSTVSLFSSAASYQKLGMTLDNLEPIRTDTINYLSRVSEFSEVQPRLWRFNRSIELGKFRFRKKNPESWNCSIPAIGRKSWSAYSGSTKGSLRTPWSQPPPPNFETWLDPFGAACLPQAWDRYIQTTKKPSKTDLKRQYKSVFFCNREDPPQRADFSTERNYNYS